MNAKPRPNHREYIQMLREMTGKQRLAKAFEMSALRKQRLMEKIRRRFPNRTDEDYRSLWMIRQLRDSDRKRRIYSNRALGGTPANEDQP